MFHGDGVYPEPGSDGMAGRSERVGTLNPPLPHTLFQPFSIEPLNLI